MSPACARLVAHTIRAVRPARVLVEGPSEMNARLGELALEHRLPIAVLSYHARGGKTRLAWTPFFEFSPEWVALETARAIGAPVSFIDLPAWHPARELADDRAAELAPASRAVARLAERLGVDDFDGVWDRVVEQPLAAGELARRLRELFVELRAETAPSELDRVREDFMARAVAAGLERGSVVAVVGGLHAPAIEQLAPHARPSWPDAEPPVLPQGARAGSYLVPFSSERLERFASGAPMPAPAFQQAVWQLGPERAAEALLANTAARLRANRWPVSTADLIAARSAARALAALRGHEAVARTDVLDAVASALVKDALEAPLPWRSPVVRGRVDPLLVEVLAAFRGDAVGELAPETPRPPLLADVARELAARDLVPAAVARAVALDLAEVRGLARSRVLHRLRVLCVPGFARPSGPEWPTDAELVERWQIVAHEDADAHLIEAGAYGATLESAAARRLEDALADATDVSRLAALLGDAVFAGASALSERLLGEVVRVAEREPSFGAIGAALAGLLGLLRHAPLEMPSASDLLRAAIAAAFARGLWLLESLEGPHAPADAGEVAAVAALRSVVAADEKLVDRARAVALFERRQRDGTAPPAIRGAALGALWSLGAIEASRGEAETARALRAARPETLGDFLVGLFALAREAVAQAPGIVRALDRVLDSLDDREFLVALPAMRLAFSFFPPRELDSIGRVVVGLGREGGKLEDVRRLGGDAATVARGHALELEATQLAERFGLSETSSTTTRGQA
jgi:hypothetical protein